MSKQISTTQTAANITLVMEMLAQTPDELERIASRLSPHELREPLGEGERSLTQVLAHLINCEARSSEAIYLALLRDEPQVYDVHPEREMGKLLHTERFDFADLLHYFGVRRKMLLGVLAGLSEARWARVVSEEKKRRKESVYWLARSVALHEQEHLIALAACLPEGAEVGTR